MEELQEPKEIAIENFISFYLCLLMLHEKIVKIFMLEMKLLNILVYFMDIP